MYLSTTVLGNIVVLNEWTVYTYVTVPVSVMVMMGPHLTVCYTKSL